MPREKTLTLMASNVALLMMKATSAPLSAQLRTFQIFYLMAPFFKYHCQVLHHWTSQRGWSPEACSKEGCSKESCCQGEVCCQGEICCQGEVFCSKGEVCRQEEGKTGNGSRKQRRRGIRYWVWQWGRWVRLRKRIMVCHASDSPPQTPPVSAAPNVWFS